MAGSGFAGSGLAVLAWLGPACSSPARLGWTWLRLAGRLAGLGWPAVASLA